MSQRRWMLHADERGNPATRLDRRHESGQAWTNGNDVRLLLHGRSYFPLLMRSINAMGAGDLLMFTDWRGDPDELMDGPTTEVSRVLCAAVKRGVLVRGLVWRSHLDRFAFSEQENRHLGEEINAAGGRCLRDMRVRIGGSHHQKFVVLRHRERPELDVAFVGGIDLCHSRSDDAGHSGDLQSQPMAKVYGPQPPWHDAQLAIRGPAVGDVEAVFRERWEDPAPLNRNPIDRVMDWLHHEKRVAADPLPPQLPDPAPRGEQIVQLLRTYPKRRQGYPFAPDGERSIARGYEKAVAAARQLILIEDQYLWSTNIVQCFAAALRSNPQLRLIAVIPAYPDQDGRLSQPPNLIGRMAAMKLLSSAGGDRVAVYGLENSDGTPIYVHAKICVIDDEWCCVGSGNLNRRSWTHDSELSCAVLDDGPAGSASVAQSDQARSTFAQRLRLELSREHLGCDDNDDLAQLDEAGRTFAAFAASAERLDGWHAGGQVGPRPAGQLRRYRVARLRRRTQAWADPLYRLVYDPDGRPQKLRRAKAF